MVSPAMYVKKYKHVWALESGGFIDEAIPLAS
jgi:hypothetical protein